MACGCTQSTRAPVAPSIAERVVHGAVGLAKVAAQAVGLPVDQAPEMVIKARRDICRGCPNATLNAQRLDRPSKGLTTASQCRVCGCLIAAKTRLASEKCPASPPKW
jgi:flavoprotein